MGVTAHQVFIEGDILGGHSPRDEAALEAGSYLVPVRYHQVMRAPISIAADQRTWKRYTAIGARSAGKFSSLRVGKYTLVRP